MAYYEPRGDSIRVTVRLPGGKRETATFDTMKQAEEWAEPLERKKKLGMIEAHRGQRIKVEDLWSAYHDDVGSKMDSARWNLYRINTWSTDPLAQMMLSEVTTHEINQWAARRAEHVSGSTVNREMNLMSACFTYAVKVRKWLKENPCHGASRPEHNPPRDRALLTADEIEALCIATGFSLDPALKSKSARVGACFLLALETGMRSGEILRLRPQDYDRDRRVVKVAAVERGGRKGARSGRARHVGRMVPLTSRAIELLDQLLASKPEGDYIVGVGDKNRDALWRKAVARSGVSDAKFHDTKHEAATRLSKFLDVLALSHALGTKDVRLLRDTYYNDDAERSAALLPSSLLKEKSPA